jgi:hypothetical protein
VSVFVEDAAESIASSDIEAVKLFRCSNRSEGGRRQVRPANRDILRAADGSLPDVWLIAEWPPGHDEPVKYWLANLDQRTPLKTLVRLAKIRWRGTRR